MFSLRHFRIEIEPSASGLCWATKTLSGVAKIPSKPSPRRRGFNFNSKMPKKNHWNMLQNMLFNKVLGANSPNLDSGKSTLWRQNVARVHVATLMTRSQHRVVQCCMTSWRMRCHSTVFSVAFRNRFTTVQNVVCGAFFPRIFSWMIVRTENNRETVCGCWFIVLIKCGTAPVKLLSGETRWRTHLFTQRGGSWLSYQDPLQSERD